MKDQETETKYIRFENKESILSKLEEERSELGKLEEFLRNSNDFYKLMTLPDVELDERLRSLKKIFAGSISDEALAFLCVLFEQNGVYDFSHALQDFRMLLNQEDSIKKGIIYSVKPLSAEQIQSFRDQTARLLKEDVSLVNRIDRSLLGGICIMVDGKMIDISLRKKLEDLHLSVEEGLQIQEGASEQK